MQIILTILAIVSTLFLPGFVWSFVFFGKNKIDYMERLFLSFALSVVIVPLIVFYTNMGGVRITMLTVCIQIFIVILMAILLVVFKEIKK